MPKGWALKAEGCKPSCTADVLTTAAAAKHMPAQQPHLQHCVHHSTQRLLNVQHVDLWQGKGGWAIGCFALQAQKMQQQVHHRNHFTLHIRKRPLRAARCGGCCTPACSGAPQAELYDAPITC